MFWDDIVLVTEKIKTYGLNGKFYQIGGQRNPPISQYGDTGFAGAQNSGFHSHPFSDVDPDYEVIDVNLNSQTTRFISTDRQIAPGAFACLYMLERTEDPIEALKEISGIMEEGSYLILTALFEFPYHPSPVDYWRFTPDSLAMLARRAGLAVVESDWHINHTAGDNIVNPENSKIYDKNQPQTVRTVYAVLSKGQISQERQPPPSVRDGSSWRSRFSAALNEISQSTAPVRQEVAKETVSRTDHSCLFLNTYYPAFLENFYSQNQNLLSASYDEQLQALQSQAFGDSDFYSSGLRELGWNANDLIINCAPLQAAWARENQGSSDPAVLLLEQIQSLQPEIIYVQDMYLLQPQLLDAIRPHVKLIVGQNAAPSDNLPFDKYDLVFSAYPYFVDCFRNEGVACYLQPLAFESRLAREVSRPFSQREHQVSFVGGLTADHASRYELLEALVAETPIEFWGYGADTLALNSPVRSRYRGEAWGLGMFEKLGNSQITLNMHINAKFKGVANNNYAANMRLYEATGSGALLITDYRDNLHEIFEIGKEVVAYRSIDEAVELVKYYLAHPAEAEAIAAAGQKRTLETHSYKIRMEKSAEIMSRFLKYKDEEHRFDQPDYQHISYGYTPISSDQITSDHLSSWQSDVMPNKQRALVQNELREMYRGNPSVVSHALVDPLRPYVRNGTKVLEIGCSSGYYYEIMEYLLAKQIDYTGVDYSQNMIDMAREYYPTADFVCADGANMPFPDKHFEVVNSSCVLLHCPNYQEHIAEAIRVTGKALIVHRTPICKRRPTQLNKKFAYGVETVELRFEESEFLSYFKDARLRLVSANEYESHPENDEYDVTYLFEKQG